MRTFSLRIPVSLAFALIAAQAFAHAQLEKATPAVGGTVSPPKEIRLEFSEGVDPKFTGVTLTSACGASVPVGPAKTETGNAAVLVVPNGKPLSPGAYTVRWPAVSVDTHHTQGTFDFTVQ